MSKQDDTPMSDTEADDRAAQQIKSGWVEAARALTWTGPDGQVLYFAAGDGIPNTCTGGTFAERDLGTRKLLDTWTEDGVATINKVAEKGPALFSRKLAQAMKEDTEARILPDTPPAKTAPAAEDLVHELDLAQKRHHQSQHQCNITINALNDAVSAIILAEKDARAAEAKVRAAVDREAKPLCGAVFDTTGTYRSTRLPCVLFANHDGSHSDEDNTPWPKPLGKPAGKLTPEVCDSGNGIDWAIKHIRFAGKAGRRVWPCGRWIQSTSTPGYILSFTDGTQDDELWRPSTVDLLAEDWDDYVRPGLYHTTD